MYFIFDHIVHCFLDKYMHKYFFSYIHFHIFSLCNFGDANINFDANIRYITTYDYLADKLAYCNQIHTYDYLADKLACSNQIHTSLLMITWLIS